MEVNPQIKEVHAIVNALKDFQAKDVKIEIVIYFYVWSKNDI